MSPATPSTGAAPSTAHWARTDDELLAALDSASTGLSASEAARRLDETGPNRVAPPHRHEGLRLLVAQFESPIMLILVVATVLAMVLGDLADGAIILAIIAASGTLGFWQERAAGRAVDALLDQVEVRVEALRGGQEVTIPAGEVVRGDVVLLRVGDIVPADCRVLDSKTLLLDETAMTGEAFPVEKQPGRLDPANPPARRTNTVHLGTHVVSGSGTVLVVATGSDTEFGELALQLAGAHVTTRFERGLTAFGALLVRAMLVLVTVILVVNLLLQRPVIDSVLFSLALAVGLTPQLLPAIVSVSLSAGARMMAAERVIVKRLDAIEDFGAMSVLCTDKTGTLTHGVARLEAAAGLDGRPDDEVLRLARLNAGLQHGFANPLDQAILEGAARPDPSLRLDEVPYDFERRRLSILVAGAEPVLVTKGAVDSVLEVCSTASMPHGPMTIDACRNDVTTMVADLGARGARVLAVATRILAPGTVTAGIADEASMTLVGILAFADSPKPGAAGSIETLRGLGVDVRLITGDNRVAAGAIARSVGLDTEQILTGEDIESLDAASLADAARSTAVFAEVRPLQKSRIVDALRSTGETVGFLGDGVNDAAALHTADVGISVDSAVDVAKQAAAIVLLDKSLDVIADGVRLGRRTFANTLKYIRVTTSANFGNMLSMAAASAFLPFLPLLPRQILLLNFLSDIPALTIAADTVDEEQLDAPRAWDLGSIRRFMVVFGLISSAFDLVTFATLRLVFDAGPELFRSGWFVVSTLTELTVMLVLRTARPFWRSRPASPLLWTSAVVAVVTVSLPYTALAGPLGLVAVPVRIVVALTTLTVVYVTVNELAKRRVPGVG